MRGAQTVRAGRPVAVTDRAWRAGQHGVVGVGPDHGNVELGAHQRDQATHDYVVGLRGLDRTDCSKGVHSTPALASSARRSSTPRCT